MKKLFLYLAIILTATSCLNTKKFKDEMQLFQRGLDSSVENYKFTDLKLKAGDNVIISVYTLATNNQDQTTVLNLGGMGKTNGTYQVNVDGQIDLPKIGLLKVEGLTLKELKAQLISKWSAYVKDIGVNVQLQQLTVNIIGEVKSPGSKSFLSEKVTLLEAIASVSGITDDAKRNDILVIRESQGKRIVYKVDLRDASFYNSPAYQLQQNDLIVVGMSDIKFKQRAYADFNQQFTRVFAFVSFLNIALGITTLIITLNR
jgi:polysaccharide export outer membrane protein